MRKIRIIIISICLLAGVVFAIGIGPATEDVGARSDIRAAWVATYPSSTSFANASCQTCHVNPGGGSNGWNEYGWSIRQAIRAQNLSVQDAIDSVAVLSADADGNGISNISEINSNAQPGWRAGAVNTIYFSDGSTQANQLPPTGIGILDAGTATLPNPTNLTVFLPYVTR